MTLSADQIDSIVQEVVRQLTARGVARDLSCQQSAPSTRMPAAVSTLVVPDRVVTMSLLKGRLAGVSQVVVSPHAVVTPLVVDELRELGIRLTRSTDSPAALAASPRLVLTGDVDQCRRAAEQLGQMAVDAPIDPDLDHVLAQLAESEAQATRQAVILSTAWATLLCQANRNPKLRAAAAFCPATARQACQQLNPNVFVLDANWLSDQTLQATIREFIDLEPGRLVTKPR